MLSRIYNLINYCYWNDSENKLPAIELQLFLIAVKCLMPYENDIGCYFDADRYMKEIELFKCYKNGHDEALEYYLRNESISEKYDNLLEYKIIPAIVVNTQWDILLNEALKAAMFYSSNNQTILDTICISSIINEYISAKSEGIDEITKERLINFSLKDFLIRNNIKINKSSLIEFEKERINIISKPELISEGLKDKFKSLHYIYNETKNESEFDNKNEEATNETVLYNFSSYLYKLRKGIINPEKLKIQTDNIPSIKEFLKYASFNHPLLGRCKILKRGEKEVIIRNKSGLIKVNL